jgi:glycosyltransferase involved in cell wall biosynthesis
MKRLGIVAPAGHEASGVFHYTLSMIQALVRLPGWLITIYKPRGETAYSGFGLEQRDADFSQRTGLLLALRNAAGLPAADIFSQEDVLIAATHTSWLLHTTRPFAYTLHDLQDRHLPENFSLPQRIWRRQIHARLCSRANRILCESDFVRRDIHELLGIPNEKISVVQAPPYWQDDTEPRPQDLERIRASYKLPARFLFYPAQFWKHKNHARLVQAFAQIAAEFPDLHLVFTGHRRHEFDTVMRLVESLGLSRRVTHLGYVQADDMFGLFRLSSGLVMPSLFESISIPVFEAFRAGVPVCASGILGMTEQVGDAGLLFDPLSVDSIAAAMRRIAGEENLSATLGARGRERLAAMTIARYATQLAAVLDDLAAPARAGTNIR